MYLSCTSKKLKGVFVPQFLFWRNDGTHRHTQAHPDTHRHGMSSNIEIRRICLHCSSEFTARTTVTKYCSNTCSKRAYKARIKSEKISKSNAETRQKQHQPIEDLKEKEFLSINETCKLIGVSKRTIHRLIEKGQIDKIKIGSRTIIKRSALNQFISINEALTPTRSNTKKIANSDFDISEAYTMGEVQAKFNISESGLRLLVIKHKLTKKRQGRFTYLPKSTIEKLLT